MAETRRFAGFASRSQLKSANNLGIVPAALTNMGSKMFRNPSLDLFDAYFEARQYSGMPEWDQGITSDNDYIPVRKRKPRLKFNFAKVLVSRLASKLMGRKNFPKFKIEDDPDTQQLIDLVISNSQLRAMMIQPIRRMGVTGSVLVRFHIVNGVYKIEHFLSKWSFPQFDEAGNLESVEVKYVFEDTTDLDSKGTPRKKWFKLQLGKFTDILFDNPPFDEKTDSEPVFKPAQVADHNLGFVQAEWFKTSEEPNSIDGASLIMDVLDFIDELNYNISQSSTAVQYNQDPQLVLSNMTEDEVDALIRSSTKAWNLGREGKGEFLESSMVGVEAADKLRDKVKVAIQDIARVIMLDPEKIIGNAQSAKAMEVLHGPMVELLEELQPMIEKSLKALILKMTLATLIVGSQGGISPIQIPPGFKPKSLNLSAAWPEIFQQTMEDIQKKMAVASTAASAQIVSRETLTRWVSAEFGIEDIEEELAKIAKQPQLNPFGSF